MKVSYQFVLGVLGTLSKIQPLKKHFFKMALKKSRDPWQGQEL